MRGSNSRVDVLYSPGGAGHDEMEVRSLETIEGGGGGHGVGAHVLEHQPVAHLQVGQAALLHDAVQPVACRAPDAAGVHDLIGLWLLSVVNQESKKKKKHIRGLPLISVSSFIKSGRNFAISVENDCSQSGPDIDESKTQTVAKNAIN